MDDGLRSEFHKRTAIPVAPSLKSAELGADYAFC